MAVFNRPKKMCLFVRCIKAALYLCRWVKILGLISMSKQTYQYFVENNTSLFWCDLIIWHCFTTTLTASAARSFSYKNFQGKNLVNAGIWPIKSVMWPILVSRIGQCQCRVKFYARTFYRIGSRPELSSRTVLEKKISLNIYQPKVINKVFYYTFL